MEVVAKKDIDLKHAKKLKIKTLESNIFVLNKHAYKIYKLRKFYPQKLDVLRIKEKKVEILGSSKLDCLVKANRIIKSNNILEGLDMPFIKNKGTLYEFASYSSSVAEYLKYVNNASVSLEQIHRDPRHILVADLNFGNIVFDEKGNIYFLDTDSCAVDKFPSSSMGAALFYYCRNNGINIKKCINRNDDTFQFLAVFLTVLFNNYFENITEYEYDALSEQISSLKNIKDYYLEIINAYGYIPQVPYLHDLLNPADFEKKIEYKMPILK